VGVGGSFNPFHGFLVFFRPSPYPQGVYIIRWDFNEGFLFHVAYIIQAVRAANAR
jgi:hypothetical protein